MPFDPRAMQRLVEESQDLHSDAMSAAKVSTAELRQHGDTTRDTGGDWDRALARRQLLKVGGFGLGVLASGGLIGTAWGQRVAATVATTTPGAGGINIQILQTAASLENLAVATYGAALELPFVTENAVVKTFAETTMSQHAEHGAAFNAQAEALGGVRQDDPNPRYAAVVEETKPMLTDVTAVVGLAMTLEEVATDTYLSNLILLDTGELRTLMASVMGVESQHLATLRAVNALLAGGAPELIAIPTDVAKLPAAAGSIAFPAPFEEPNLASPPEEGALL